MTAFMRRIDCLLSRLEPDVQPVMLVYANGERRSMRSMDAFMEAVSCPEISGVECEDETIRTLLQAVIDSATQDFCDLPELTE